MRILPGLERSNRAYWTGGSDNQLLISCCGSCGTYFHPPRPMCTSCGSRDVAPKAVSGRGKVASYSVNYQPWLPRLEVPFVFAAIELDEQAQLHVFTNIVGCDPETVRIGQEVEVVFEQHEDVYLPMFKPVAA